MKNIITKTKNKENQRVIVKIKLPEFVETRQPAAKYKLVKKGNWNYRIYSSERPGRSFSFEFSNGGAYSREALF